METQTKEIYEVLGFKIAYITIFDNGEVTEANYYIINSLGEVVSRNFSNVLEPLNLLLNIKKQLSDEAAAANFSNKLFATIKKETPVTLDMTGDQ